MKCTVFCILNKIVECFVIQMYMLFNIALQSFPKIFKPMQLYTLIIHIITSYYTRFLQV